MVDQSFNMHENSEKDEIAASSLPPSSWHRGDHSKMITDTKSEIDDDRASSNPADDEHDDPEDIHPPLERQSTEIGAPIKVARLKRRGLLGQLALVAEVENPKTYPRKMKWFITFIVAVAGATAPMGSAIFYRESSIININHLVMV